MEKQCNDILTYLEEIIEIDSPSGFCESVGIRVVQMAKDLGFDAKLSNKGCVEIEVKGQSNKKKVGVTAHLDTLGAMVRSVRPDGGLRFARLGGPQLPTLDGEYCRIYTRDGKVCTGTILSTSPSSHVYDNAATAPRDAKNMYIRLDENVKSADDTKKLGIETGDIIAFHPKYTQTESGYIKSRFLDDKAGAAIILAALKEFSQGKKPKYDTKIFLTVYEEIGHGGSPYGADLSEVLAVDMGCIGEDLACTEHDVSICAADSSGPYDYEMVSRLINLSKKHKLSYAVDIYPHYGSDISAMLRAGRDIRGALIGMGVHASHGMERTHTDGIINTYKLLMAYLCE